MEIIDLGFWQYLILFLAAFIGGFIDSISGGGGLITLPAILAVGINPYSAIATNKFQETFGTLSASINYSKKGMVDYSDFNFIIGLVSTFIGGGIGAVLVLIASANFLNIIIPILLFIIFIYMLLNPKFGQIESKPKMGEKIFYIIFGFVFGVYCGFFGPGIGVFWTLALVIFIGYFTNKAIAYTKVLNTAANIPAFAIFLFSPYMMFGVGILMGIGSYVGAWAGSKMVIKGKIRFIREFFLVVVGALIIKLLISVYFEFISAIAN